MTPQRDEMKKHSREPNIWLRERLREPKGESLKEKTKRPLTHQVEQWCSFIGVWWWRGDEDRWGWSVSAAPNVPNDKESRLNQRQARHGTLLNIWQLLSTMCRLMTKWQEKCSAYCMPMYIQIHTGASVCVCVCQRECMRAYGERVGPRTEAPLAQTWKGILSSLLISQT